MPNGSADTTNLGYKVTTRLIDWEQKVREAEGTRWNLPIGIYLNETGGERVFVAYDLAITGPPINNPEAPELYVVVV